MNQVNECIKLEKAMLEKLQRELPPTLYYHNAAHTKDVIQFVERVCTVTELTDEDAMLLRIAATYHDSGWLVSGRNHEETSADFASKDMGDAGFSFEQIQKVRGMIMATKIPQSPVNPLEEIICDADLNVLGRSDFFVINMALHLEIKEHQSKVISLKDWFEGQLKFIESHSYFTQFARAMRDLGKQKNAQQIRTLVNSTK